MSATTERIASPPGGLDGQASEHVLLLDPTGRVSELEAKRTVHTDCTPFHLAFSCHVVDANGRVLLTRRALAKRTWPGVWTNACCGHPQLGESIRAAVGRRLREELGLDLSRLALALPDFAYRAEMPNGVVEHELCPVVIASVEGRPTPDPREVDDHEWTTWTELHRRAIDAPQSLSPWVVEQLRQMRALGVMPLDLLASDAAGHRRDLVDRPTAGGGRAVAVADVSPPDHQPSTAAVAGLDDVLREFLAEKAAETSALDPRVDELVEEIRLLVDSGGKRLRPAFVWWGHRATGADLDPAVLRPAAAVELLHTFALLHDDVMDRSATRRGRPSVHTSLAGIHRARAGEGDADWFGYSSAILAGDLTYVWADELFDSTPLPPDAIARARAVFTELRREVIAGQYLDLVLAADHGAGEEGALRVALLKSARYTVTRPLLLGAALAPAHDGARVKPAMTAYGDAVGLAFQMRDDILGMFGDPGETGKSRLDDLREGKRTLLVLRAMRLADHRQAAVLRGCLGDAALDDRRADDARTVIAETGALASVEALVAERHAAALDAVEQLPEPARQTLVGLADQAIERRG